MLFAKYILQSPSSLLLKRSIEIFMEKKQNVKRIVNNYTGGTMNLLSPMKEEARECIFEKSSALEVLAYQSFTAKCKIVSSDL